MGMSGSGNQPGQQGIPEGAQMPTPVAPTGIKGPPVQPGYSGSLAPQAPQSLGDLQRLQHLPPFLQFFMALQGKAHGGSALSAFHNMRNRGM